MDIEIEREDIQGLLVRGYKNLGEASFAMLQFSDGAKAKKYLNSLCEKLTNAVKEPTESAIHFAFTFEGIMKLGLPKELNESFSRQFKEGMTESTRQIVLGDVAENAPEKWNWGNWKNPDQGNVIHGMLMIYASNKAILGEIYLNEKQKFTANGISEVVSLPSQLLPKNKEHFGFHDGISQPTIKGLSSREDPRPENVVSPGEFILGYLNQYEQLPDSPFVLSVGDSKNILPAVPGMSGVKDFGRNGSYLVFRQMSQDVVAFWKYMKENSREGGSSPEEAAINLGSKMIGRKPNGDPLIKSPDPKDATLNNFNYWEEDKLGLVCPIGAHVRRTNPRDYLVTVKNIKQNDAVRNTSTQMIQKHRILRRGRTYGEPLTASMEPEDLIHATADGKERGLYFICLAGDLIRQFEFIQNAWTKFHKFGGLYNDADPIVGTRNLEGIDGEKITADQFTVPAEPIRRSYKELPQFTQVKGGAYFFYPGIKAFRYLCAIYDL